jgi:hypothetical protein
MKWILREPVNIASLHQYELHLEGDSESLKSFSTVLLTRRDWGIQ